jgi:sugar lactone lactonase YvrE
MAGTNERVVARFFLGAALAALAGCGATTEPRDGPSQELTKREPPSQPKPEAKATEPAPAVSAPSGAQAAAPPAEEDFAAYKAAAAQASAAYERKDFALFLEHSRKAAQAAPYSPNALYNLACAHALSRDATSAAAALDRLSGRKVYFNVAADSDFDPIRETAAFQAARERLEQLKAPITRSSPAITIPEKDLIPEGIAHDTATGSFFVSSVHKRKIVRIAQGGARVDFATESKHGLFAVLGLAVDASRRVLWACTSAVPEMSGYRAELKGQAALVALDLGTGRLLRRLSPPDPGREHNLNDLAIDAQGNLFVSDAVSSAIYMLPAGGDALSELVPPGKFTSPQGIALSPDERSVYVADYARGVARVDKATRAVTFLAPPEDAVLTGIDGLRMWKGDLIAIQNGIRPHRVVRLSLREDGSGFRGSQILEMNNPTFNEPTLGVTVGQDFYYIANSQWGSFTKGVIWPAEKLSEPVVLRMRLD